MTRLVAIVTAVSGHCSSSKEKLHTNARSVPMLDQILISFVLMGGCLFFVCLFQFGDAQISLAVAGTPPNVRPIPVTVDKAEKSYPR